MTMITPSYLGETIEYSSLHACRSTLEDPTRFEERDQLRHSLYRSRPCLRWHRMLRHAHPGSANDHAWVELPLPLKTERSNRLGRGFGRAGPGWFPGPVAFDVRAREFSRRWAFLKRGLRAKVRGTAPQPATRTLTMSIKKLDEAALLKAAAERNEFLNLHEVVAKARQNLNQNAWDYIVGGVETETTLRRNRMALDTIAFRPRVLRDVSKVDVSTELLAASCGCRSCCARSAHWKASIPRARRQWSRRPASSASPIC